MPYLLDTDVLRYYLDGVEDVVTLVTSLIPDGVAVSMITYLDLYQGTLRTREPEHAQEQLTVMFETIPVLPFSSAVARRCAQLADIAGLQTRFYDGS